MNAEEIMCDTPGSQWEFRKVDGTRPPAAIESSKSSALDQTHIETALIHSSHFLPDRETPQGPTARRPYQAPAEIVPTLPPIAADLIAPGPVPRGGFPWHFGITRAAFILCLVKMGRAYAPTVIATSSLHCPACPSPMR